MRLSESTGFTPWRRIFVTASLVVTAAIPSVAQSPSRDKLVADTRLRIKSLTDQFEQIGDAAQQKLNAANCRVDCPPEIGRRVGDEMTAAMDRIAADIHAQVDSFFQRMVDADGGRVDVGGLQSALQSILPQSDERPSIYAGSASSGRYLIAAYAIHKGEQMGLGATSVTLRAYTTDGRGVKLADVTGGNMDGYAGITVQEVHPWASNPVAPVTRETYLLLSGYLTGANGPNNRMRLYAYDGKSFRPIWMPENVWGNFKIETTKTGFVIQGDYYRESRKRRDEYTLLNDGVMLSRSDVK
jgi:hypothetical protein